ncbi:MAG: extracellular solute-binding protein [Anaerolineae bacterium]|nr:extracellular solute-binding protein [Anaerolineae bacterium]
MFKRLSLVALSVVLLGAMFMVSMNMGTVQAQDDPAPTATPVTVGSGGLEISFWNGLTGSDGVTLIQMMNAFAEENPDISVVTEQIAWNDLYAKMQAAFVAGQPPDVFLLHGEEVPQYYDFGVIQDLSGWYDIGGGYLPADDFAEPAWSAITFDGAPYAVLLDNHGRLAYVNVDMFEAAGLDPSPEAAPATYEEYVEWAKLVTLDANGNNAASPDFDPNNVVQWGTTVSEWMLAEFYNALGGFGGTLLSEDGLTVTVNSEEGMQALQNLYDLIYVHHVAPVPAGFDTWLAFGAGQLAILPTGGWFLNQSISYTDINSQAWPVPPYSDNRGAWLNSHAFMVPVQTSGEKLEAVQRLIFYLVDNQLDWAATGQTPSRFSAREALDPEVYGATILAGEGFAEYGVVGPKTTVLQELAVALDAEINAALNDLKPVEQALNDAAERMQGILDRANR